jgi:hypothetical protein
MRARMRPILLLLVHTSLSAGFTLGGCHGIHARGRSRRTNAVAAAHPLPLALASSLSPQYMIDWPLTEPSVPITGSSVFAFMMLAAIFAVVTDPNAVASSCDPYAWRHISYSQAASSVEGTAADACILVPTPASVVKQTGGNDDRDWWVCPHNAILVGAQTAHSPECVPIWIDGEYTLACAF